MKKIYFAVCIDLIVCVSSGWAARTDLPIALGFSPVVPEGDCLMEAFIIKDGFQNSVFRQRAA